MRKRLLLLSVLLLGTLALVGAGGEEPIPFPPGPVPDTPVVREPVDGPTCIGPNLLTNPSFEGEYSAYVPPNGHPDCPAGICMTAQTAAGWTPYWQSHDPADPGHIIRMPEYKPAELWHTNPDRVRDGARAQQYFSFHSTHRAGMYQRVNVVAGEPYCFSMFGHAWSSANDYSYSDPVEHGYLHQKIGVDPTGGTDWESGAILWGQERIQYDYYGAFMVEATAQQNQLTVYAFSEPWWAVKHNDVYWDEASLVRATLTSVDQIRQFQHVERRGPAYWSLPVTMHGPSDAVWTATVQPGAQMPISVTPSGGVYDDPLVAVDGSGLAMGVYGATVVLSSSNGAPDVTVPITLEIKPFAHETFLPAIVQ